MRYYYTTNADGTTHDGFAPFADGDLAEAPDWVPDDRECGAALHVVAKNPLKALWHVDRSGLRVYEVEPLDARPERGGKIRCRAVRRIRELSDAEIASFATRRGQVSLLGRAGHAACLRLCIQAGVRPTEWGADAAAWHGHAACLAACIQAGVLPTAGGADAAARHGNAECLRLCAEAGIRNLPKGCRSAGP